MLEKLETLSMIPLQELSDETNVDMTISAIKKINALIDTVNELQKKFGKTKHTEPDGDDAIQEVIHADPYAEQRKWIGKLCRFWDDDAFVTSNDWAFGILTSIDKGMQYQYSCNENCNFKHCEPVKPDEEIIYKGE